MVKIKQISAAEWAESFRASGSSNYFASPDWLNIQAKIFNLNNLYFETTINGKKSALCLQEKDKNIYLNFIAYGGILTDDGEAADAEELRLILAGLAAKDGYKLTRLKTFPLTEYQSANKSFNRHQTAWLKIRESDDEQQKGMDKKTRNLIRKALAEGVEVRPIPADMVDKFYVFYKETMARVGSSYLTPVELLKYFSEAKDTGFLGAYLNDELIAGSVFMRCNRVMFYWLNSSTSKGRETDANYLLIKTAIDNARKYGIKYLDMGSSHSDKILLPKLKWGAELKDFLTMEG